MATPRRKTVGAHDGGATNVDSSPWTGALRFAIYEENSGRHRWRLTTSDGRDLATSCESFASHEDAQRAVGDNRA